MNAKRVLVVGAGTIARNHARAVESLGDHVVGVVDPDLGRAQSLAPGTTAYPSLDDALRNRHSFDAAIVASPSSLHLDQTIDLLTAGIPVLLEKPHRVPGQSVVALAGLVERGGHLQIGMSTRHWPGMIELHRAARAGEFGTVLSYVDRVGFRLEEENFPSWYFRPETSGGGILITNGVHVVDRARWILGEELLISSSRLRAVFPGHTTEDDANVIATTSSGIPVYLSLSWSPFSPQLTGLLVHGTKGGGVVGMDGKWSIRTERAERGGPAIDLDTVPFERQWAWFKEKGPGFGLADIEPALKLIEEMYKEDADG